MTTTGLRTFDHSLVTTKQWLSEVKDVLGLEDEQQAFFITRAVLHTLRDRLPVSQVAKFAAQMPMLLQGVYYHEWTPAGKPIKMRTRQEFLAAVAQRLLNRYHPAQAVTGVFSVIQKKIPQGEIDDIKKILPAAIRELWPPPEQD
jgi:uncharacterized protein (DUF2267 family)